MSIASNSDDGFQHDNQLVNNDQIDSTMLDNLQSLAENNLDFMQNYLSQPVSAHKVEYVSGPLLKEGTPYENITKHFITLINHIDENVSASYLRCLKEDIDEVQKAVLVSHTMAASIGNLNQNLACRIGVQMVSDTSLWISKIFRFFDSLAYFDNDKDTGLTRVIHMALYFKYPKYMSVGYEALFTRPPVIYYCDMISPGLGQNICRQLGLPLSCVTSISCGTSLEEMFKMDTTVLEKTIIDDIAAGKMPLAVITNAGIPIVGFNDNLQKIQELCLAHNVWLHVNGNSLATLSLNVVPNLPSNIGDSITLNIGPWLGLSLPYITLYKAKDMTHVHAVGLGQAPNGHLHFLPVWVALQVLGSNNFTKRIHYCFELGEMLLEKIRKFTELRIISKMNLKSKEGVHYEFSDVGEKSVPTMVLFELLTTSIVFQYKSKSLKDEEMEVKIPPYYDNLNSWLAQLLTRHVPRMGTEILDLEQFGICIRICPLENAHTLNTSRTDVENFIMCLEQQINILNSTVLQKEKLYREYNNHPKLQLVEIANWAGMGGVRYIPDFWANRLNELTDTDKEDINQLNSELVAKLRVADTAFSYGEADDGMLCVRFGMVDDKLDMDELINLVVSAGQELEESSKFLETMSEMIKHGIEEANKELVQENEEKLMQEGILRQVPVIGSLVSWWYPTPKETGIKGRSFNLTSGTIESTENIYRYHMQIKEDSKTPQPATKILISPSSSHVSSDEKRNALSNSQ